MQGVELSSRISTLIWSRSAVVNVTAAWYDPTNVGRPWWLVKLYVSKGAQLQIRTADGSDCDDITSTTFQPGLLN